VSYYLFSVTDTLKEYLLSNREEEVLKGLKLLSTDNLFANLPYVIELIRKKKGNTAREAARTVSRLLEQRLSAKESKYSETLTGLLSKLLLEVEPDILLRISREFKLGDINRRLDSLYLLRAMSDGKTAAQILKEALSDTNKLIRSTAVKVLGKLAVSREPAIIASFIRDTDPRVRANAVEALEETANKNILGILIKLKKDNNNRVRGNVLKALWKLGYQDILGDLKEMLSKDNELMRSSAVWVIGEIGKDQKDIIALLALVEKDNSQLVRTNVLLAQDKLTKKKKTLTLPKTESNVKPAQFPKISSSATNKRVRDKIIRESGVTIQEQKTRYFTILTVEGPLNLYSVIPLKLKAEKLIEKGNLSLALDFAKVTDVDTPVIGFLANLNRRVRESNGKFMIFNVSYDIMVAFNFANLDASVLVFTGDEKVDHLL